MCDTVVAEGAGKIRDGKKWKRRWLVLRKPSPVADCLVLYVYKERGVKERSSVTLEHICGLETHVCGDGVSFTLSILCLAQTTVLGFDIREAIQSWDLRLRYCLGEVHSFSVSVLPGTKLESGPATLHLCNSLLVIAKDQPPVITGHWNLLELRRYGPVSNGFVFEGGTRCGSWAGVFFLSCSEGEQISFLFDCIVRGICPSRGPFGLKPLLPECGVGAVSVQDRLKHEAEELERRLSMLSHSTASSSSVGSSVTGDACSISGSSDTSDTSQSDCSASSRPALWTESALPSSSERSLPPASKTASQESESLSDSLSVSANLTDRSRKLKDTGRQSSSDSGIATGSHSSYTGSFSSYSGSLDAAGPEDECGTLLNLPSPAYPEKRLCTCPPCPAHEYQVPSSLRYLYDTPRRLLEDTRMSECSLDRTRSSDTFPDSGQCELMLELNRGEGLNKGEGLQGASCSKNCGNCGICSAAGPKSLFTTCPACGGLKGTHLPVMTSLPTVPGFESRRPSHSAHSLLYENCLHCRRGQTSCHLPKPTPPSRSQECFLQDRSKEEFFSFSPEHLRMSLQQMHEEGKRAEKGKRPDSAYEIMESRATERSSESEKSRYELMGGCAGSRGSNHLTEGGLFAFPLDGLARGDLVTYVNIPISPMSKKQLNYMEVELQEASAAIRGRSSSKYAQIDITATEAAHRAGTQHALGREEGLQRLEQRRRGGAPQ